MLQPVRHSHREDRALGRHAHVVATALTLLCLLLSSLHWNDAPRAGERAHGFGHWVVFDAPAAADGKAPSIPEDGRAPAEQARGDSPAQKRRSAPLNPVSQPVAHARHGGACCAPVLPQAGTPEATIRPVPSPAQTDPRRADPALALHRGQAPPARA